MRSRNAIQVQKIRSPHHGMIWLGIILTSLFLISSCRFSGEPSDEQIEQAKEATSDIRATLYTPADAKLLAEKLYYGTNPDLYPGCVSVEIYLAYHSPLAFEEILGGYRAGLGDTGWEPSQDYSHDHKDIDVFQTGSQTILFIASFPIREDILVIPTPTNLNNQQGTIYYIQLLHYEPTIHECRE